MTGRKGVTMNRHGNGQFQSIDPARLGADVSALEIEIKRIDQLREADQRAVTAALAAAKEAVAAALLAADKAVNKAEEAQARVNVGQNEFRGTLSDQATRLMPRAESENTTRELRDILSALANDVVALRSRVDIGPPSLGTLQAEADSRRGARQSVTVGWGYVIAVAGVVIGAVLGLIGLILPRMSAS